MDHQVTGSTGPIAFRPRYKLSIWLAFVVIGAICTGFFALSAVEEVSFLLQVCFGIMLFVFFTMPLAFIREVSFDDRIYVKRYLVPDQSFSYTEVRDIGEQFITLPGTNIDLSHMKNAAELKRITKELLRDGRIDEQQLAGVLVHHEKISKRAATFAVLAAVAAIPALRAVGMRFSSDTEALMEAGVGIVVLVLAFAVLKRRGAQSVISATPDFVQLNHTAEGPATRSASVPMTGAEKYAAWVGPNWSSHYARAFQRMITAKRNVSWNWAAALFPPWWVYRRQYAMFIALMVFEAFSAFTVSDAAEPWSSWDSTMLAVVIASVMILGMKGDSLVLRQGQAFLAGEGAQASRDEIAAHGRPKLPQAVMATSLWLTFLILL